MASSRYTMKAGLLRHMFGIGKPVHPSAPWTEQPWAYFPIIPEHYLVHGTWADAEVLPDSSNVEYVFPLMSRKKQHNYMRTLLEKQKGNWNDMTLMERRASYYVAFGPHGPRKPAMPPGAWKNISFIIAFMLAISYGTFHYITSGMVGTHTISREWQEATNEYARKRHMNPISGVSSEGYRGKGFVA